MIAYIKGIVVSYTTDSIVIDNHGVGYQIFMPNPTSLVLQEEALIYTYEHIREDAHMLFGFTTLDDKNLFERLISVKGIGPKIAINALGAGGSEAIVTAIETNNAAYLKSLPGIGNKAASQIVLDLKGKLVVAKDEIGDNQELNDAVEALKTLGYKTSEINSAIKKLNKEKKMSVDGYVREALKFLYVNKGV